MHTGGALIVGGGTGFFNVGANGGTATLDIATGGQVYGTGASGLTFMNVGRQGANGTVHVDGVNSSITLSGVGAAGTGAGNEGNGAFMTLGRDSGGVATATVTGGASILIRDGGHDTINSAVGSNLGAMRVRRERSRFQERARR